MSSQLVMTPPANLSYLAGHFELNNKLPSSDLTAYMNYVARRIKTGPETLTTLAASMIGAGIDIWTKQGNNPGLTKLIKKGVKLGVEKPYLAWTNSTIGHTNHTHSFGEILGDASSLACDVALATLCVASGVDLSVCTIGAQFPCGALMAPAVAARQNQDEGSRLDDFTYIWTNLNKAPSWVSHAFIGGAAYTSTYFAMDALASIPCGGLSYLATRGSLLLAAPWALSIIPPTTTFIDLVLTKVCTSAAATPFARAALDATLEHRESTHHQLSDAFIVCGIIGGGVGGAMFGTIMSAAAGVAATGAVVISASVVVPCAAVGVIGGVAVSYVAEKAISFVWSVFEGPALPRGDVAHDFLAASYNLADSVDGEDVGSAIEHHTAHDIAAHEEAKLIGACSINEISALV